MVTDPITPLGLWTLEAICLIAVSTDVLISKRVMYFLLVLVILSSTMRLHGCNQGSQSRN